MKMVYVRFGKIENPKFTRVYEGIVIDNEIQLLMPKISHGGARDILEDLGFGDVDLFLVTGIPVDSDDRDRIYTKATKVIQKLEYDPNTERILIPQKTSFVDDIPEDTSFWERMSLLKKELKRLWGNAKENIKPEEIDTGNPIKDFFIKQQNK